MHVENEDTCPLPWFVRFLPHIPRSLPRCRHALPWHRGKCQAVSSSLCLFFPLFRVVVGSCSWVPLDIWKNTACSLASTASSLPSVLETLRKIRNQLKEHMHVKESSNTRIDSLQKVHE